LSYTRKGRERKARKRKMSLNIYQKGREMEFRKGRRGKVNAVLETKTNALEHDVAPRKEANTTPGRD